MSGSKRQSSRLRPPRPLGESRERGTDFRERWRQRTYESFSTPKPCDSRLTTDAIAGYLAHAGLAGPTSCAAPPLRPLAAATTSDPSMLSPPYGIPGCRTSPFVIGAPPGLVRVVQCHVLENLESIGAQILLVNDPL